jgi:hypothetical protein
MFRNLESTLDECFVDNDLGSHVCQFESLLGFHLLAHGLEVSLHSVDTY